MSAGQIGVDKVTGWTVAADHETAMGFASQSRGGQTRAQGQSQYECAVWHGTRCNPPMHQGRLNSQ
ncbi:hypothetical protein OCEANICA350_10154 [Oceanicaulis sp. 350]|nr:hypothetical protein OCEANICA350_10154 [Oceanicaulis sp. 350]